MSTTLRVVSCEAVWYFWLVNGDVRSQVDSFVLLTVCVYDSIQAKNC